MDSKTEMMVAMSAAIGANCIPCIEHLYSRSREVNLSDSEIREIVEIASKVKNGASIFIRQSIAEILGDEPEEGPACCAESTGCC